MASKKKRVIMEYQADSGLDIYVAGDFNDWAFDATQKGAKVKKMKEDKDNAGTYKLQMYLPEGQYEYKFYCDGVWHADPNAEQIANPFGTANCILKVGA